MANCRVRKVLLILFLCLNYECSGTKEPCLIMSDYTSSLYCQTLLSDLLIAKKHRILSCFLNISIEEADGRLVQCFSAGRFLNDPRLSPHPPYCAQTRPRPLISFRQKDQFQCRQQRGEPSELLCILLFRVKFFGTYSKNKTSTLILNKLQIRKDSLDLGQTFRVNIYYKRWMFLTLQYPQHPDSNKFHNILLLNYSVHKHHNSRKKYSSYLTVMVSVYVHLVRSEEDQPDFLILQPLCMYILASCIFCRSFSKAQIDGLAHGFEQKYKFFMLFSCCQDNLMQEKMINRDAKRLQVILGIHDGQTYVL